MKPYRLLRNNKESGPYSADELIQMGLKAYDLVWEDGKSASWRYPCEIAALKPYAPEVEEQPFDRFYKKPSFTESSKKETSSSGNVNAIPNVAVTPQKPRIRIKADSKIIEVAPPQPKLYTENLQQREIPKPVQKEIPKKEIARSVTPVQQSSDTTPGWKDMWLNWEEEKKAVNAANGLNVRNTLKNVNRYQTSRGISDDEIETKFSQSLDDIKERYVETVLKQKNRNKKSGGLITVIILVAAILGMGVYMGLKWGGPGPSSVQTKIPDPNVQKASEPVAQNEENKNELQQNDDQKQNAEEQSSANETTPPVSPVKNNSQVSHTTPKTVTRKNTSSPAHSKSAGKQRQEQEITDSYTYQSSPNSTINKDVADKSSGSLKVNEDVQATAIAKFKKSEPKIGDYINVDASTPYSNSAVGVKLKIQNVSDIPVDLVMVDLQYMDANGRFEKGETVYVRNIAAGSTVTIPAPDYDKAAKVNYKVSMVSSEKNNLYLIAD
jgi:hypothetical protein